MLFFLSTYADLMVARARISVGITLPFGRTTFGYGRKVEKTEKIGFRNGYYDDETGGGKKKKKKANNDSISKHDHRMIGHPVRSISNNCNDL